MTIYKTIYVYYLNKSHDSLEKSYDLKGDIQMDLKLKLFQ